MDIRLSEHEKRVFKLGLILFKKKFGKKATTDEINKYLLTTKCKPLREIVELINFVADKTENKHQGDIVRKYALFGLWLCCNHPELKRILESLMNRYTKYNNVKIDLKPNISRIDRYLLERGIIYVIKKMSERPTYITIVSESGTCTNKIARYVMDNIAGAMPKDVDKFMEKTIKSFIWVGIWIGVNDTAYRSQFYYIINKIGNNHLHEISKEFYFEPEDWYINLHTIAHRKTVELWNKNEIPMHENALLEDPCMVKKQKDKIDRILKEIGGVF